MLRSSLRTLAAAAAACLCSPAAALAADGERTPVDLGASDRAAQAVAGSSGGGGLVRTIVGLFVVLAVIYGLHWVLKQVKASREERASGQGLRSLATLPLGPSRSLHLVRAGGEVVLVGVGEGGVTPVRTYSEAEARALGLLGEDVLEAEAVPATAAPAVARGAGRLLACVRSLTVRG
jgi:flagellar protein FliO/FliZ